MAAISHQVCCLHKNALKNVFSLVYFKICLLTCMPVQSNLNRNISSERTYWFSTFSLEPLYLNMSTNTKNSVVNLPPFATMAGLQFSSDVSIKFLSTFFLFSFRFFFFGSCVSFAGSLSLASLCEKPESPREVIDPK